MTYMRQSKLFTKTKKEAPADEVSKNAEYLSRGGFIHKEMAGVYTYLPMGLRVINKIENIIREELNKEKRKRGKENLKYFLKSGITFEFLFRFIF